jgi:competence protein CoiA
MIWANKKDIRIQATPKDKAICPLCKEEVIAKCGEIKIWHWSHKSNFECDLFGEPETEWHFNWKQMFPKERQEITIQTNQGLENHRADIKTKDGTIIELQNSPLSQIQITEREDAYDNLIWILNGKTIGKNIEFFKQRYKWRWFPPSWAYVMNVVYIDKGDMFLYLINPVNSEGEFIKISKDAFIIEHGGKPWQK